MLISLCVVYGCFQAIRLSSVVMTESAHKAKNIYDPAVLRKKFSDLYSNLTTHEEDFRCH